jgi:hypothetical protein
MSNETFCDVVISGSGIFTPGEHISNKELVESFNHYVGQYNQTHSKDIAARKTAALEESSADFITRVSKSSRSGESPICGSFVCAGWEEAV